MPFISCELNRAAERYLIVNINDNFLKALEYELQEIQGKYHSMFAESMSEQSSQLNNLVGFFKAGNQIKSISNHQSPQGMERHSG